MQKSANFPIDEKYGFTINFHEIVRPMGLFFFGANSFLLVDIFDYLMTTAQNWQNKKRPFYVKVIG